MFGQDVPESDREGGGEELGGWSFAPDTGSRTGKVSKLHAKRQ